MEEYNSLFKPKNYKLPHNWYDLSLNSKNSHISLTINSNAKNITSQVYILDNKDLFDYLYEQKEEIEDEMKEQLIWDKKNK